MSQNVMFSRLFNYAWVCICVKHERKKLKKKLEKLSFYREKWMELINFTLVFPVSELCVLTDFHMYTRGLV